ncbi:hypothetical protein LCGC14_0146720 [marine sediment metagenome]|uniref:Glycine zipper domain-containing protein n=1 Tax=marine sediment metagenome TaxID=412755 RepID=A0A0F9V016_9ZZZZ
MGNHVHITSGCGDEIIKLAAHGGPTTGEQLHRSLMDQRAMLRRAGYKKNLSGQEIIARNKWLRSAVRQGSTLNKSELATISDPTISRYTSRGAGKGILAGGGLGAGLGAGAAALLKKNPKAALLGGLAGGVLGMLPGGIIGSQIGKAKGRKRAGEKIKRTQELLGGYQKFINNPQIQREILSGKLMIPVIGVPRG